MLTPRTLSRLRRLEEPSPKSSRPLTSHVAIGHRRAGSKPTDSCRLKLDLSGTRRIHPPDQDRPTFRRNDPRRLPSCRVSCELAQLGTAFHPCRADALRHQTGSKTGPARLTVRFALRTPIRSSECLYTRLCGASSPRAFPTRARLHPKLSSFSEPTAHRASGEAACFELVRPSYGPSCDSPRTANTMRTTDFCFPNHLTTSTRASYVTGTSSRLTPRPWPTGLHPRPGDRWTWRFTTPNPLR